MKKKLHFLGNRCALLLLVLFSSYSSFSQMGSVEAGITIGPSNFLGDLGGNAGKGSTFLKDNNFSQTKVIVGGHLTFNTKDWLSLRLAANFGSVSGDDAAIKGKGGLEEARRFRNQNFKSAIAEAFVAAEIYPTVFLEQDPDDVYRKLRPYGLIGIGAFYFNPKGKDPVTGEWVSLKPLRTEGQGMPEHPEKKEYSLTQINVPMGIGVKYYMTEKVSLSLEIIHRFTFTDYIDDVSTTYIDPALFYQHLSQNQAILAERMADKRNNGLSSTRGGEKRGTSTNNDGYYSIGFKLGFNLSGIDKSFRNSTRCPILRF